jgi:hypothetical protein
MTRGSPLSVITLALLAGCHGRDLELCDIAQSDCQEDVYYADLRLRGDGYDPFAGIPPIRTISEDQYRAELEARAERSPQSPSPWWDAALPLLHLLPSSAGDPQSTSIDNQVQNTAAYYSPSTRKVTVVSHPSQATDEDRRLDNMVTLAHELVHALQDRELNLAASPTSGDDDFARGALIEGDASLYDYLFLREALPPGYRLKYPDPLDWFSYLRDTNLSDDPSVQGNFASLGPPFLAARWTVYPLGGVWLARRWKKGGNAAVRHAYGEAPERSLDFLLPSGVAPPAGKDIYCAPTVPDEFKNPADPSGVYGLDSFGAIELFAYLMAWGVPSSDSLGGALLWRNDFIFVYYHPEQQKTAVAWRFELASPLPDSVLALITTADGPRVVQDGSTLLVTASDDATLMETWTPGTECPGG